MFIAFEGPDNTGKSTSAKALSYNGEPVYNATKDNHKTAVDDIYNTPELVTTFDRIDWFSHMVYRLALPDHEWNDERPRTVFSMPDTHLVVKLHEPNLALAIEDELYSSGKVAQVNPVYYYFADFFTGLNEERNYSMFKTISIVEVFNDVKSGTFSQRLAAFSSPVLSLEDVYQPEFTDQYLLDILREDERQR
jgi:hypothetical protein